MFDNNVFVKDSFRNVVKNGNSVGYELETHITYYRGIPLSMVNEIIVKVDGVQEPAENLRCSVDGGEYWFTLAEMETVIGHKWEYGEKMIVFVQREGGLSKGEHKVEMTVSIRTAYIPVPIVGIKERTVLV